MTNYEIFHPPVEGWDDDPHGGSARYLGRTWLRIENGKPAIGIIAAEEHLDSDGQVERGFIAAFADHAIGCAGVSILGVAQVTLELNIRFASKARAGDFIEGRATVSGRSDDLVFLRGSITVGSNIIAVADGVWKAVKPLP